MALVGSGYVCAVMGVAFLGAGGTMGLAMARNLAGAGIDVRAWNRTREKAEPLADDGTAVADTPGEAAGGADVVLTMLSDADAVIAVMDGDDGAAGVVEGGATWLQMSTSGSRARSAAPNSPSAMS